MAGWRQLAKLFVWFLKLVLAMFHGGTVTLDYFSISYTWTNPQYALVVSKTRTQSNHDFPTCINIWMNICGWMMFHIAFQWLQWWNMMSKRHHWSAGCGPVMRSSFKPPFLPQWRSRQWDSGQGAKWSRVETAGRAWPGYVLFYVYVFLMHQQLQV